MTVVPDVFGFSSTKEQIFFIEVFNLKDFYTHEELNASSSLE